MLELRTPPLSVEPSRIDPRDWVFEPEEAALADPPAAVDLRDAPDAFPPAWDQLGLNSCTAQAMGAALHYDTRRQSPGSDFAPSRLFIYYNERRDEGTLRLDRVHGRPVQMRDCVAAVAQHGTCAEATWPYLAEHLDDEPPAAAYTEAAERRASSYHRVQPDLAHLKACLAQGFPFLFGLRVYASFPPYGSQGDAEVPLPRAGERLLGGHALLAVGYDDARGAFIVRNSWGTAWGVDGHAFIPYAYLTDPALAFDHWVVNAVSADASASTGDASPGSTVPAPPAGPPASIPAVPIFPRAEAVPTRETAPAVEAERDAGAPEALEPAWQTQKRYGQLQALVLAGDRLLGVGGGTLFALDCYGGGELGTSDQVPQQGFPYTLQSQDATPLLAADGGTVFFTDAEPGDDPQIVALRVADGQPLSGWQPPAISQTSALLSSAGTVVALGIDPDSGAAVASGFDAVTGATRFGPVTISDESPGAVAYGAGAMFFVAGGALQAVNVDFGDTRWSFSNPEGGALDVTSRPAVGAEVVLAASSLVHGVDLRTGRARWSIAPADGASVAWDCAVDESGREGVAANSGGELVAFSLNDGVVRWRTPLAAPGVPTLEGDTVSLLTDGGSVLTRVSLADGAVTARYALPLQSTTLAPVLGNASVFIAGDDGSVSARRFGEQAAAWFDGRQSHVDIRPDAAQFDFGTGDFTVEAWVKSCEGGEVVSSYPTSGAAGDCGFRLNLTPRGEVRVAVVDPVAQTSNRGQTGPTTAADGEWHHLALLRRDGAFVVLVDGLSYPVRLPASDSATLSLGGSAGLTLGAYVAAAGAPATSHFRGLLREVRIWDRALDVATVQGNARVELTGSEPRLKGLWPLDDVQSAAAPVEPRNQVLRHRAVAVFNQPASYATDLEMDDSAFPYLLHEPVEQWPYAGTWAVRGEHPLVTAAAFCDGVVAFASSNAVYGVHERDGSRAWSLEVGEGCSAPVAGNHCFYLLTGEESVVSVSAASGAREQVGALAGLSTAGGGPFVAPAVSDRYLAAAGPTGSVLVLDLAAGEGAQAAGGSVAGTPRALALAPFGVAVLSAATPGWTLSVLDPGSGHTTASCPVDAEPFCAAGAWLLAVRGGALVRLDPASPQATLASSSGLDVTSITGIAAAPEVDLVVVTTTDAVHGLSLATLAERWATPLPGELGVPRLPGFDAAGRIFCTTGGGAVVALEWAGGGLLGAHRGVNPVITPALLNGGTAYYGCVDPADPQADVDGALHSAVFGETVALRLGLDWSGAPAPGQTCAVVDAERADCTLHLLDVQQSCVEAWINLPPAQPGSTRSPGGGILGICPTFDPLAQTGWGLSLALDADGTLRYSALTGEHGVWTRLDASAPAPVLDGRWHHLAVSRGGDAGSLLFYLDGVALPGVVTSTTPVPAPATLTGLKAFIGANADAAMGPVSCFCGMIAEVRVWDTYLVSTDIATRMHVKLRGDEPDLLAFWNFDRVAVHDGALQGHDGTLTGVGSDPAWWLTDLPFTAPAYPWIESTAVITQEGQAGAQGAQADTEYTLTLRVHRADGATLAAHPLQLWYVRHGDDDPPTINVDGTELTGVLLGDEHAAAPSGATLSLSVTTGDDGSLSLPVITPLLGHGPSLDVRAGFMPANERFHVSTLLDNQKLARPTPPVLSAQAKLIQDYHYSDGNRIDETRDRSTWRVVLRAANADQSPRAGEQVSVWSSDPVTLESAGTAYPVTRDNPVTLSADAHGELALVLPASGLSAPTLYARASFMHRDDQVVVKPDQDAHARLASVTGSDLTTPRLTNWKPGATAADHKAVLSGDYAAHGDAVAGAVHHVMASTTRGPGQSSTALGLDDASAPVEHDFMRQPARTAPSDQLELLRTLRRAPRVMPVNPDALRAALAGSVGFVFDTSGGAGTLRFALLATADDVARERAGALPLQPELGGFFSDLWDDVKDAAEDAFAEAQKIAITVANTVNVAITQLVDGVEHVKDLVISRVEDALNAVVAFFNQLGAELMAVIEFLRELFDWGEIIRTHRIVRDTIKALAQAGAARLRDSDQITGSVRRLAAQLGVPFEPPGGGSLGELGGGAPADSGSTPHLDSVKGKMMTQKTQENPATGGGSGGTVPSLAGAASDVGGQLAHTLAKVPALAGGLLTSSPGDVLGKLEEILKELVGELLEAITAGIALGASVIADALVAIVDLLDATIDIPFVSALYHWLTGDDLSLLDLFALLVAVPLNLTYLVATTLMGRPSAFADDAAALPQEALALGGDSSTALGMAGDVPLAAGSSTLALPWVHLYTVMQFGNIAFACVNDLAFAASAGRVPPTRNPFKILQAVTGMASSSIMCFYVMPRVERRLIETVGADKAEPHTWYFEARQWTSFSFSLIGNAFTLADGIRSFQAAPVGAAAPLLPAAGGGSDLAYPVLSVVAAGTLLQIHYLFWSMSARPPLTSPSSGVGLELELFCVRDILYAVPRLFGWMFTQTFSRTSTPAVYDWPVKIRTAAGLLGLGFDVAAAPASGHSFNTTGD